jgi:hexosaminidase
VILGTLLVLALTTGPADPPNISIVPRPVSVMAASGDFLLTSLSVIYTDSLSSELGRQLSDYLRPATGYPFNVMVGDPTGSAIVLERDSSLSRLGPEGYRLAVKDNRVTISAPEAAGIFYGIQSLRQLLPTAIFRSAPVSGVAWIAPAVIIEDYPRFAWRGAHLDVCRHFMPKEFVKKYIDLLALQKLNSFHWHLTEDQGWRIEIKRYPRLTQVGAWRKQTLVGRATDDPSQWVFDGQPHGGFYTQDDIREIVAYAKARFINVVPEIEMPGHSQAAIAAYPELGVTGDTVDVWTAWGVTPNILNVEESTITFMQNVLTEVMALFPGPFIHIGGDEAWKRQWQSNARVQQRMRELHIKTEDELQSWFIHRMDTFLTQHGRRLVGWDEILEGGLAPNATVMSWRGTSGGITAARAGHDVVMAPGSHTYLDHYQTRDRTNEPLAIGGFTPIDTVYAFDPMPPTLEPQYRKHILGAQVQVWTEYIKDPKQVEYMAFPRMLALSEALWTPVERKNFPDFLVRLRPELERLSILDVNFHPIEVPLIP